MAIPEKQRRRPSKWVFGAPIGTSVAIGGQGESIAGIYSILKHKSPVEENLRLKAENAELRVENETLKAKVVAMQVISSKHSKQTEGKIALAAITAGIINEIKEEFPKFTLISGAYCALSEQMNEISINVIMDSLDYDTEKELIKFFIKQEDKFPQIELQTRFTVQSIEEADEIYLKEGSFDLCYKRDK